MNKDQRNALRNIVMQSRRLLERSTVESLQGRFGIHATGIVEEDARMSHLDKSEKAARRDILDHYEHIKARGFPPKEAFGQLVREISFTHFNRLCAYKMMEAREVHVGSHKLREVVSRSINSNGVKWYLVEHPEDERLFNTGQQDIAYRHFLDWLGGLLSEEIGVLFNPSDSANRLYPPQRVLDEVLSLINEDALSSIWNEDETIGWVYQYFTPKELREQARSASAAPRNSYELAFRNQFFTPRYVVEFLTDNTLGRIWYEMRKGDTRLKDECRYLVRHPREVFLDKGQQLPTHAAEGRDDLSQDELFKVPAYITHREKKDPRELRVLDPACGSGHFLLYCFDLLLTIYEEAYSDPDLGPALEADYPTLDDLKRAAPGLILWHNLHGIDIDLRCTQIAALSLWLRCQRTYQDMSLQKERPKITRSNIVCAEPMPGENHMLKEFVGQMEPKLLGQLVEVVFDKMELAGEAGSLLKIEEEIREAVAEARNQWKAGPQSVQQTLFEKHTPVARQQRFDFSGISEAEFFEQAEAKVVDTLREYAEQARDGQRLQRHLFTEDAVQGFAFVDLCHKQFDVILMNPPFGELALAAKPYVDDKYPTCRSDYFPSFVVRALEQLGPGGRIGAITSRTGFFLSGLADWRHALMHSPTPLVHFADLGHGVLDDALVETAAYVITNTGPGDLRRNDSCMCLSLLNVVNELRGLELLDRIRVLGKGDTSPRDTYLISLSSLAQIPTSPLAYRAPPYFAKAFAIFPSLNEGGRTLRVTNPNGDDFRFIRARWEVPTSLIGKEHRWAPLSKGGEYLPWYADIHLVVDWDDHAQTYRDYKGTTHRPLVRPASCDWFFKKGITFSRRTASRFNPRVLPEGCAFSDKGPAIFCASHSDILPLLCILSSRVFQGFLEMFLGAGDETSSGAAARSYEVGTLKPLPIPDVDRKVAECMRAQATAVLESFTQCASMDETASMFRGPFMVSDKASTIREIAERGHKRYCDTVRSRLHAASTIDAMVATAYRLPSTCKSHLDRVCGPDTLDYPRNGTADTASLQAALSRPVEDNIRDAISEGSTGRFIAVKSYVADRLTEVVAHRFSVSADTVTKLLEERGPTSADLNECAAKLLSYAVGCCFGRWDVRSMSDEGALLGPCDPFTAIPQCPPGMLTGPDGMPAVKEPDGYPAVGTWDGIMTDDAEHQNDIARRCREIIEAIFGEGAEAVENEACKLLNAKELRDYFQKPTRGGFWDDHVSRYSKSRRKAPIYWLLQSSKKNYALWLYYHRLDKDLLFKALVNYMEPKLQREVNRLDEMRRQKQAAGEFANTTKKVAKDIERQEDKLSELRDFEDKLRRAANLHLEPDLNDGVVLNIAPLHELVPWKEAKKYWEELLEGKYEWSSIGKQLRDRGVVK